jgi:hypothetical protein
LGARTSVTNERPPGISWEVNVFLVPFSPASCLGGRTGVFHFFATRQQSPKIGRHRRQLHRLDFFHAEQEHLAEAVHSIKDDSDRRHETGRREMVHI